MSLKLLLFILLSEIFISSAQVMFKKGANNLKSYGVRGVKGYIKFMKSALTIPAIWGGFSLNVLAVIAWIAAISIADLSLVMPISSVHYMLVMAASYFILKEKMTSERIIGTLCILLGILLVAIT